MRGLPAVRRLCLAALAASAACAGSGPAEVEEGREELARARARWDAAGLESYRYLLTRHCFCVEEAVGPAVVRVEDGVVTRVSRPATDEVLPGEHFPSVEGLFELLEEAVELGAHRVDVEYHPVVGVPLRIWIDRVELAVDEELGFEATLPEPLD